MKTINYLFIVIFFVLTIKPSIAEENVLHIGLLKWGSVNWEIDIIEHNKLDKKNNITIKKTFFSTKNDNAIALQGKSVDMIVTDWVWVSRQREQGADFTLVPYSTAAGALMVPENSQIKSLNDIKNHVNITYYWDPDHPVISSSEKSIAASAVI